MWSDRGVSSVIGTVMILALTVGMVTSLMLIGTLAISEGQAESDVGRMKNSMSQLSSKASLVALDESLSQRFDLGTVGTDQVTIDAEAGRLHVYMEDPENGTTLYETDELGAITYENGDVTVAYQAGGIWGDFAGTGGHMVSPPEFHYRSETLTLPLIEVTGDGHEAGIVRGTFTAESTETMYPNDTLSNPVDNKSVFVEIESQYHRGWYNFLDRRSDGELNYDPDNATVTMELSLPFDEEFNSPVAVQEGYELQGNPDVDENQIEENANYPSATDEIDDKIADCESGGCGEFNDTNESGRMEFTGGETYFTNESIDGFADGILFNTSDGDIEVVVNGTFQYGQDEIVVEGDGAVRVFLLEPPSFGNQDINMQGNATADQFRVYIHSSVEEWEYGENPSITGVIYAPSTDITFTGSIEVIGAVIANSLELQGSVSIEYDEALENSDLGFDPQADVIRFLHLTVNKVLVEFD